MQPDSRFATIAFPSHRMEEAMARKSRKKGAARADGPGLPRGAAQTNPDFGAPGGGGPCPPVGDKPHRYNFTLYALKVDRLDVSGATASLAGYMVNANAVGKARLTGKFGRKK